MFPLSCVRTLSNQNDRLAGAATARLADPSNLLQIPCPRSLMTQIRRFEAICAPPACDLYRNRTTQRSAPSSPGRIMMRCSAHQAFQPPPIQRTYRNLSRTAAALCSRFIFVIHACAAGMTACPAILSSAIAAFCISTSSPARASRRLSTIRS